MSTKKTWQTANRLAFAMLLFLIYLGVTLPSASTAQGSLPWRGEYFDNQNLTGQPLLIRNESAINFDWGANSPDSRIPFNHFSARWSAYLPFEEGAYIFRTYTDDGVRLWVDGRVLIDQWHDQVATLYEQQVSVSAGYHSLRMEYYDDIGNAVAMLWWVRLSGPVTSQRWRTEYFNNPWLIGEPVLIREETEINYNWGNGAPAPNVAADNFSVRWTGNIGFGFSDSYTFTLTADDGARVWVDGGLLIDRWNGQAGSSASATRYVTQGTHPIIVEYYEASGNASITFSWQKGAGPGPTPGTTPGTTPGPTQTPTPSGEIIVDDRSSGFQKGGPNESWYERSVGYDGHMYWTYNSDAQVYNFAKWTPRLPNAGNYQVYAFIPRQRADTKNARYRIHHSGQEHVYPVDQSVYFDKWVSLGTYYFAADSNEYVYLDDVTFESYATRKIGFDAVKFVSTAGPTPTSTPTGYVPTPTSIAPTQAPTTATATPAPPTATPVAPTPTPTLLPCSITPMLGFGRIWTTYPAVRSRLGCPVELEKSSWSAEETFVGGYMFWRGDLRLIYALYNNSTWQSFVDTWYEGQLEWDPAIVPPAGYYQPKRGFGKVWREQPGVRDKLGWATTEERGLSASWQAYQTGLMLWSDVQGIFVLYSDGTWCRYQ